MEDKCVKTVKMTKIGGFLHLTKSGDITVGPHQFLEHRKFKDVDCRARCCASLAMAAMVSK